MKRVSEKEMNEKKDKEDKDYIDGGGGRTCNIETIRILPFHVGGTFLYAARSSYHDAC